MRMDNLNKPYHDVIIVPFSTCCINLKTLEKKGKLQIFEKILIKKRALQVK